MCLATPHTSATFCTSSRGPPARSRLLARRCYGQSPAPLPPYPTPSPRTGSPDSPAAPRHQSRGLQSREGPAARVPEPHPSRAAPPPGGPAPFAAPRSPRVAPSAGGGARPARPQPERGSGTGRPRRGTERRGGAAGRAESSGAGPGWAGLGAAPLCGRRLCAASRPRQCGPRPAEAARRGGALARALPKDVLSGQVQEGQRDHRGVRCASEG